MSSRQGIRAALFDRSDRTGLKNCWLHAMTGALALERARPNKRSSASGIAALYWGLARAYALPYVS
jgi:hypothetical protein